MVSASTPASLAETASATLFVALELSRSTGRVALHAPLTSKVSQHRLDGGDADGQPVLADLALLVRVWLQGALRVSPMSLPRGKRRLERPTRIKGL